MINSFKKKEMKMERIAVKTVKKEGYQVYEVFVGDKKVSSLDTLSSRFIRIALRDAANGSRKIGWTSALRMVQCFLRKSIQTEDRASVIVFAKTLIDFLESMK